MPLAAVPGPRSRPLARNMRFETLEERRNTLNKIAFLMVAGLSAVLAACGGGGGSGDAGGGTQPLAAECTPSKTMQYGSTGDIFTVSAGETVVEMQDVAQAVSDASHTIQATSLSPGAATLAVYALNNGHCSNAVAATALVEGTPTRTAGGASSAQERLFLVLESSANVAVQMCAYAGATPRACDPGHQLVAGVVTGADGQGLAGVNVGLSNAGQTTTNVTDQNGQFWIDTPAGSLPDSYVVDVYDGSHVPVGVPVTQTDDGVDTVGVSLGNLSDNVAPLESAPVVHHLGDGLYTGVENSQLQMPDAEGLSRSYDFTLTAAQLAHASASLDLVAKGVNCADEVTINGQLAGTLALTPADGSYGAVHVPVPMALLAVGANTATITSVTCDSSDYDDFEYSAPVIDFQ
jgi:hypothetical protein